LGHKANDTYGLFAIPRSLPQAKFVFIARDPRAVGLGAETKPHAATGVEDLTFPRSFENGAIDLDNAAILITGGTGSFGQQMVRTLLSRYRLRRLVVFSRDELKQYDMSLELPPDQHPALRYFIGDVRDADRLEMAIRDIDYVIHAAALKQVPTAEYNPFECIKTNVHGAENVVRAVLRSDVKKVVALSTDKAASPINLYGASKLASDKIFVAANNLSGSKRTLFSVVRYGNVIGSRGSVIPLFERLIQERAPDLPITDPRMTRFAITLQQGVDFVLSSLETMHGGEIFVPKIPSIKITDLAEAMAPGLPHRVVGVRPGEKLHEVMITEDDARTTLEMPDRYVVEPAFGPGWLRATPSGKMLQPVPEAFRYGSDTNAEFLSCDEIKALLASAYPKTGSDHAAAPRPAMH
jgi:UDP-N-acetylglucosamine 4,6-dehydratase/5-epimerase